MDHERQEATKMSPQHKERLAAAKASPADHAPRLITSHQGRELVHGLSVMGQFNNRFAVLITKSVGTMWAAYLFALLSLISLPQALVAFLKGDTVTGIAWLSQSFLQLVLLPIILVGQNVISTSQDARAESDHETLTVLHTINVRQLKMLEEMEQILALLRQKAS